MRIVGVVQEGADRAVHLTEVFRIKIRLGLLRSRVVRRADIVQILVSSRLLNLKHLPLVLGGFDQWQLLLPDVVVVHLVPLELLTIERIDHHNEALVEVLAPVLF